MNLPAKSNLTVALEPNRADVGGGYAIGRILANGVVAVVGKMGDGTKLAWGTTLVADGGNIFIPVYGRPVRGGVCAGWLYSTGSFPPFQGSLRWIRPAAAKPTLPFPDGFAGSVSAYMDYYVPPARGTLPVNFGGDNSGTVGIAGVPIGFNLNGAIQVDGTRFSLSDPLRSFSINRATGLFSGKMKSDGKIYSFKGAVLQSITRGIGSYSFEKKFGVAVFIAE